MPAGFNEQQFAPIAEHKGLIWRKEIPATNERAFESIYSHTRLKVEVHLILDDYRGLTYLVCCGEGLDDYFQQLKQSVPWVSPDQVIDDGTQADDMNRLARAVYCLDVIKEEIDKDKVLEILRFAIASDDPGVIDAVVTTISYFGWRSMRPLLEGLLDHDDEQVREEAASLLEMFDEMSPHA